MAQLQALQSFIDEGWITEVEGPLKSGKEATAFCCRATHACGSDLVLAKVYKEPEQRGFRNDAAYREGIYIADSRLRRAVRKNTQVGRQVDFQMWMSNEYDTLCILHAAGADVPRPLTMADNAILMEYFGDENGPAPQLSRITLDAAEAQPLFDQLMANIRLWLACHRVHADLSAFNILYWQKRLKIIDFPQAVDARSNSHAFTFLRRDIENVCNYFSRYGIAGDVGHLADLTWEQYLDGRLGSTGNIDGM